MEFDEAAYVAGKTKEAFGVDTQDGKNFKIVENSSVGDFSVEIGKDGLREGNYLVVFRIHMIPFEYLGVNRKLKSVIKTTNKDLEAKDMRVECVGENPLRLAISRFVFDYEEGKDFMAIRSQLLLVSMPIAMSLAGQNFPTETTKKKSRFL